MQQNHAIFWIVFSVLYANKINLVSTKQDKLSISEDVTNLVRTMLNGYTAYTSGQMIIVHLCSMIHFRRTYESHPDPKWNVTPLIRRGSNFYLFAALYYSCHGFNALLASPRYEGLQKGH